MYGMKEVLKVMTALGAAVLLMLALAVACQPTARAEAPAEAVMLVAMPDMSGDFEKTVLLAVPVPGVQGAHFGFMLNKPTDVTLGQLFPEHPPSKAVLEPIFLGGPHMSDSVNAVVGWKPESKGLPLFGDFHAVIETSAIDSIIESTPNEARYYAGWVVWKVGELDAELEKGFWRVIPADPALMRAQALGLWEDLVRRQGLNVPAPGGATLVPSRFAVH